MVVGGVLELAVGIVVCGVAVVVITTDAVKGTPPVAVVAPLKAGACVAAFGSGVAVVLAGFRTLFLTRQHNILQALLNLPKVMFEGKVTYPSRIWTTPLAMRMSVATTRALLTNSAPFSIRKLRLAPSAVRCVPAEINWLYRTWPCKTW